MNAAKGKVCLNRVAAHSSRTAMALPCACEEAEPFPIIRWCEDDENDSDSYQQEEEECTKRIKRRSLVDFSNFSDAKTASLVRSKSFTSQL